jgi:hypothetical protein
MVAVPLVLCEKRTELGSAPVFSMEGTGVPVAVMAKEKDAPTVAVKLSALVIVGGRGLTVNRCWT